MEILPGNATHAEACAEALRDSELGRRYFAAPNSAYRAVMEGIDAGTLYVAMQDGAVCGFMYYIPDGAFHSFPYLHLLVVCPARRGTGIGSALLRQLERLTDRSRIFLCVADFNPDGKRFYERNGYRQVGRLDDLYRVGISENLMMKVVERAD